jgi:hypothetical protein
MRLQSTSGAALLSRLRWDIELVGTKNGVNDTFTVPPPDKFVNLSNVKIRVHYNGQRLLEGALNDYVVSESGGPSTGFDTITLNGIGPKATETLTADYVKA